MHVDTNAVTYGNVTNFVEIQMNSFPINDLM